MCCPLIDLHRLAAGPAGGCELCSAQKSHQEVVEADVSSPHLESPDPQGIRPLLGRLLLTSAAAPPPSTGTRSQAPLLWVVPGLAAWRCPWE